MSDVCLFDTMDSYHGSPLSKHHIEYLHTFRVLRYNGVIITDIAQDPEFKVNYRPKLKFSQTKFQISEFPATLDLIDHVFLGHLLPVGRS